MLVFIDLDGFTSAARYLDRYNFLCEVAFGDRVRGPLLRAQGESVLVGARDLEFDCDVFCSIRHGIDAVLLFHQRVDETPADGGVENLRLAREGLVRLA